MASTVLRYSCGTEYRGEVAEGVPCGAGELCLPTGVVCTGEFSDGAANGTCVQVMPNGDMFVGLFRGGRRYGSGKFVFAASGQQICGTWVDGVFLLSRHGLVE